MHGVAQPEDMVHDSGVMCSEDVVCPEGTGTEASPEDIGMRRVQGPSIEEAQLDMCGGMECFAATENGGFCVISASKAGNEGHAAGWLGDASASVRPELAVSQNFDSGVVR